MATNTAWIEQKYIYLLSPQLNRFRKKDDHLFNFRCPICGDSKKNRSKARAYIYLNENGYVFHCHNCSQSMMFYNLLKRLSPNLYDQYVLEAFFDKNKKTKDDSNLFAPKKIEIMGNEPLKALKKISLLKPEHPAKRYVVSRQIPTPMHAELFWCPRFKEWTNSIIPGKFQDVKNDEGRLIIPLLDHNNVMFGYQGRSLNPHAEIRYITIKTNDKMPKVWGLHRLNTNIRYYVVEGPIDGMFISNTIAACGGDIVSELKRVDGNLRNATIVYDNQPRNSEVVNSLLTAAKEGFKVCVWPSSEKSKDINAMILSRIAPSEWVRTEEVKNASIVIKKIIDSNTFEGLEAELRIADWRKI